MSGLPIRISACFYRKSDGLEGVRLPGRINSPVSELPSPDYGSAAQATKATFSRLQYVKESGHFSRHD